MKKTLAVLMGLATLGSMSSIAFADVLPEGQMSVPGCAMVDNTADFKNTIFIAATYDLESGKGLIGIVKVDKDTCINTGKPGYSKTELFAIRDDKGVAKYLNPEEANNPPDPELDSRAFISDIPLDGSDTFYPIATARSAEYYHKIYHVMGFRNDVREIGLVLSEEKSAIDDKKHEWTPTPDVWKPVMDIDTSIFTDVKGNDNYVPSVMFLKRNTYISGYPDGSYKPQNTINRAEFTKIVMHNVETQNPHGCNDKPFFKDVPAPNTANEKWYSDDICRAFNNGIIMGYSDNTFRPDQPITFAEAAKIILKVQAIKTGGATTPWHKEFTDYFQKNNILPTTIKSHDTLITRGDMALLIRSIIDPLFHSSTASIIDPLFYKDTHSIIDPLF